ncbi:hypothetical protein F5Y04DRAFT_287363 [Hypomontagnella monticulosa]|nr:hypothetical protein F5Y04DRAFT_287363 [Hypomontagnella monticulosa]
MDNGHPLASIGAALPLMEFQPFNRLKEPLQETIWDLALEQAATEFQSLFPEYSRTWAISNRIPYLTYSVPDLPPLALAAIKRLFGGLFRANRKSHSLTSSYVSVMHERGRPCGLALKFVDVFTIRPPTLQQIIGHSPLSNEELRTLAGEEFQTQYPQPIMANYLQQLNEVTLVTNLVVTYEIFEQSNTWKACRDLLTRLPHLRTLYVNIDPRPPPPSHWYLPEWDEDVVELSEIHDGKIKFRWEDFDSFEQGFGEVYRRRIREAGLGSRDWDRAHRTRKCFQNQENWRAEMMDVFLESWEVLSKKGVKCVLVDLCQRR